jgi:hypothetical protein
MDHAVFMVALILASSLLALFEIQVEGGDGWAAKLPTWRMDNWLSRALMAGKPLTGYHTYLITFVFVLLHAPFWLGLCAWSTRGESRVISFILFLWFVEDFLWFAFNPKWGLRRFKRELIWWHAPTWWWFMPRDYWVYTFVGSALYAYSWGWW